MSYAVDGNEVDSKYSETANGNVRVFTSTNQKTTITATLSDDRKMYGLAIRYLLGNETKEEANGCTVEQLIEVVGEWMGHTEMQRVIVAAAANAGVANAGALAAANPAAVANANAAPKR